MRLTDQIKWISTALVAHRLRSMLTIIGFAVGIGAVAFLSAIGEGLRQYILNEFTQFGSHILAVTPGKTETFGLGGLLNTTRPLSLDDATSLYQLPEVETVIPAVMGTAQVKGDGRSRYTDVAGVGPDTDKAWKMAVAQGRFLPHDDLDSPRSFAVLGSKLKTELFGHDSPLGQYVHIAGQRFKVVGVFAQKGEFLGMDLDELIYIPAQKALQLFNRDSLMEIDIFYRDNVSAEHIEAKVKHLLINRHGREDFTLVTQDGMLSSLDNILGIVKAAGIGLGAISLLVGGVGILTIFNITLNERRQEIGLMRALGFTSRQLQLLFLGEATALAIAGGLTGYALVIVGAALIGIVAPDFPVHLEFKVFAYSLLVSTFIGLAAGIKPATDASKLPPIEALRDE